jgi:hypothetical protein
VINATYPDTSWPEMKMLIGKRPVKNKSSPLFSNS